MDDADPPFDSASDLEAVTILWKKTLIWRQVSKTVNFCEKKTNILKWHFNFIRYFFLSKNLHAMDIASTPELDAIAPEI